ncbi:hypothetical protein SCHPADRAFT_896359 [Schizopora paradoxa]|uniref:Uncharacterized protein n=1 Tax=Schizopora paradoxa TaxID=27342 RepID=A0A0H2R0T3_9AGAM|nr:hypothetical protein SCHPADRAFT_896359 [Schizopora paradoxa]
MNSAFDSFVTHFSKLHPFSESPSPKDSALSIRLAMTQGERGRGRAHFHDHPGVKTRNPDAYLGVSSGKAKSWCMLCYDSCMQEEMLLGPEGIASQMWARPDNESGNANAWITERPSAQLPNDERSLAKADKQAEKEQQTQCMCDLSVRRSRRLQTPCMLA